MICDVGDLDIKNDNPDEDVKEKREFYAQIALLLFLPFRNEDDLKYEESFWMRYMISLEDGTFWSKGLEILQNIQDVNYNCLKGTR